ncbi:MAG: hypothetical protein ACXVJT_06765 [Thermoanaerobaculia bacterium]
MQRIAMMFMPFFVAGALAASQKPDLRTAKSDSILELPQHAILRSQITLPDSPPFHLKATIRDLKNPANADYRASIEEYWVSPRKWRRVISARNFSRTLVVNGSAMREEVSGDDYYPNWLRAFVDAMFDPGAALQGVDLSASNDNPHMGGTEFCRRFGTEVGVGDVKNDVFATYCFEKGLISSIGKPGYSVRYTDYKPFTDKLVARSVKENIRWGRLELEARIDELAELRQPAESLFTIDAPNQPVQTVIISEQVARGMTSNAPAMQWPEIEDGDPTGVLSIWVSIDRSGRVRETENLNTDNPDISDAAAAQLLDWRFAPVADNGVPVQVSTILTFTFETKMKK